MDKLIHDHKVIISVGTGGVGKTTISAALGVRSAQLGYKTLILTIDPAKRLKSALGLKEMNKTTKIEGMWEGELFASMIDFKNVFDEFIKKMSKTPEAANRVLSNRLYQQLSTSLGGSQDYTSLERLHSAVKNEGFDRIVLDTPPSQHAQDFLSAPKKIYTLFEGSIFKWFVPSSEGKKGLVEKIVNRGTQTVLNQLENLTGAAFISELSDFFSSISEVREGLQSHSGEIHTLLSSDETSFLLVTGFDLTKLNEARVFLKNLKAGGHHLGGVIINRVFPEIEFSEIKSSDLGTLPDDILLLHDKMRSYFKFNRAAAESFKGELDGGVLVSEIPDLPIEVTSVESLKGISERL